MNSFTLTNGTLHDSNSMNDFPQSISRRELLRTVGGGFGMLGLAELLHSTASGSVNRPHFAPRAKRAIFLFMSGGPSQVDTFDPKPLLKKLEGQPVEAATSVSIEGGFFFSQFLRKSHWVLKIGSRNPCACSAGCL
jgi:hypothetical protein